jgi:diguanylate cyclase (GGDEF)-like protein
VGGQYFFFGLAIEAMIWLASPTDPAWSSYYAGLILVTVAVYTWTYLRPMLAACIGLFIGVLYAGIAAFWQGMAGPEFWPVLVGNCFFLGSTNVLGIMAMMTRDRFSRRSFLLKNALMRDVRVKEEARRQSIYLAEHDPLTGLLTREALVGRLQALIEGRGKGHSLVAVLFIDIDGFKGINDTWGHAMGDEALRVLGSRLRAAVRRADVVARVGGDEFVVALALGLDGAAVAERVARKIADSVSRALKVGEEELYLSASVGVAVCPQHGDMVRELLDEADRQMYRVKRGGRGGVRMGSVR